LEKIRRHFVVIATRNLGELLGLLLQRDRQGVLALAEHIEATDWWDDHRLGNEA
jgi:hypothetical protein